MNQNHKIILGGILLTLLLGAGCGHKTPSITVKQEDFIGGWQTKSGAGYEEIDWYADGTYTTFLHERPMSIGRWTYTNGALSLVSDYENVTYPHIELNNGVLHLSNATEDLEFTVINEGGE